MSTIIRINSETEELINKVKDILKEGEKEEVQEIFENMTYNDLIRISLKFLIKQNIVKNKKIK